ncbi:MAG: sodium:solute symporter family protein [Planctomycetota bacterium]
MTLLGLKLIDLAVIVGYFTVILLIGFWASTKVTNDEDFFLGGRTFGKWLLMMHWLCTGTHSEMAVQVAGATARVGLGGIWYQWMWLFSTPFYWLIAPVHRRMRVITTGDFFRIRYGRTMEVLYTLVALAYLTLSIALLLRGAAAAIAGATGGVLATEHSVILLAILFSTYAMAGGLMAAAYTDLLQGIMIIVLSILLVPAGLETVGGISALHQKLPEHFFSITAPAGAKEGDPWFVLAMSLLGLVGIVVQPHVMTASGAGKDEYEARMGMCYGNFIKRLLTIAWCLVGLIAVTMYPTVIAELDPSSEAAKHASETLFGRAIQDLLGDGWRGLMIACIIAGVTSAETFMVVGSGIFTRNIFVHLVSTENSKRDLWVGRVASGGVLLAGILLALTAGSVTRLVFWSVQVIGLLGPAFWLAVVWRRANTKAAASSLLLGILLWTSMSLEVDLENSNAMLRGLVAKWIEVADSLSLRGLVPSTQILITLTAQFAILVLVSLLTKPEDKRQLDAFYSRLHTPVGKEMEHEAEARTTHDEPLPESATLGMHGIVLDYQRASGNAYPLPRTWGLEIPRMTAVDWLGFLVAWTVVGGLLGLLVLVARWGA